jgi:heat shock protein HslJ
VTPEDPTRFELAFLDDGRFGATTDCNTASGSYEVRGDTLLIGENMGVTKMACMGEVLEGEYLGMLTQAQTYTIEDDTLSIVLSDGAVMRYRAQ